MYSLILAILLSSYHNWIFDYHAGVFLKIRNIISKSRGSKVTDFAALISLLCLLRQINNLQRKKCDTF